LCADDAEQLICEAISEHVLLQLWGQNEESDFPKQKLVLSRVARRVFEKIRRNTNIENTV